MNINLVKRISIVSFFVFIFSFLSINVNSTIINFTPILVFILVTFFDKISVSFGASIGISLFYLTAGYAGFLPFCFMAYFFLAYTSGKELYKDIPDKTRIVVCLKSCFICFVISTIGLIVYEKRKIDISYMLIQSISYVIMSYIYIYSLYIINYFSRFLKHSTKKKKH